MFIEPRAHTDKRKGWIEVVCGSMFSGKTEELIRRLNRAKIANQKIEIFKPSIKSCMVFLLMPAAPLVKSFNAS